MNKKVYKKGGAGDFDEKTKKSIKKLPKDIKNLIEKMKPNMVFSLMKIKSDGQMNQPTFYGIFDDEKELLKVLKKLVKKLNTEEKVVYNKQKKNLKSFFSNDDKTLFIVTKNIDEDDEQRLLSNRSSKNADISESGFLITKSILNEETKLELVTI